MQSRTVVVIAHRLSTIRRANRIAVLEDGRITAIGSHDELLTSSPTYQRLYQLAVHRYARQPVRQRLVARQRAGARTGGAGVSMAISSMTGFARVQVRVPTGRAEDQLSYTLTVKSVNHRFLDLQFRLPSGLDALEMELRRVLKENLVRGHVDLTLSVDRTAQAKTWIQSRADCGLSRRLRCGAARARARGRAGSECGSAPARRLAGRGPQGRRPGRACSQRSGADAFRCSSS